MTQSIAGKRTARTSESVAEVVKSGLCIGCGLCEAVTRGRIPMVMTSYGSLRPAQVNAFLKEEEELLLKVCPGVTIEPRAGKAPALERDPVWGMYSTMRYAWAGKEAVRYRAASGGALTALGMHLLRRGKARFILHVGPDPEQPMRNRWVFSETPQQVLDNAGSRYGPASPLAGLKTALEREESFAIIAKPCDMSAVHRYARQDSRLNRLCVARLVMVCGGQSQLLKSEGLLLECGIVEEDVTLFRYRGLGNPGKTRIETCDGRCFERTYLELWEDEASWKLETRCKLCPDALGEAADVAAADVWPGGAPSTEDEGFNGIVIRSRSGQNLVASAVESGELVLGDDITPAQFNDFQPHQVRKKISLQARFRGMAQAGLPVIDAPDLRLAELGRRLDVKEQALQIEGIRKRIREDRFVEPLPVKARE